MLACRKSLKLYERSGDRYQITTMLQALGVKGMGPYAAEGLLRLLGHYDGLAIDRWCLAKFQRLYGTKTLPTPARLRRRYRRFGAWQGLALWLDLTRDWHAEDQPPSWP